MSARNILICHRGALGDFILTWPALSSLRELLPDASFTGVGRAELMRLAVKMGLLGSFHDAERADMLPFFEGVRLPFDMPPPAGAVLWLRNADKLASLLSSAAALPVAVIPPLPAQRIHAAVHHLRALASCYPITIPQDVNSCCRRLNVERGGDVLIHPGSGGAAKIFAPTLYREIRRMLKEFGVRRVKFVFGPAEIERGLAGLYDGEESIRPPDLCELAEHLSTARLYIGNDSGVSHLAGMLGVPTVAFFRSTDPAIWGILGPKACNYRVCSEDAALEAIKRYLKQQIERGAL